MIGLGSNRLTVCRRGGMSVTQAGRGGMEWLAGYRDPIWASPYSAQATAALKAQFPTQLPTIRDYGFAHPALVPFINKDPMLVCSLIPELGVIRWLVGDGVAYAITDYKPSYMFKAVSKIKSMAQLPTGSPFAAANNYDEQNGYLFARSGQYAAWYWTVGGVFVNDGRATINTNTKYDVEITRSSIKINGTTYAISGSASFNPTRLFVVMGRENGTSIGNNIGLQEHQNYEDNVLVQHIVPCKNPNGNDFGILDIVTKHWFGNSAGAGSFSIEYTEQDGVTPWTPAS